MLYGVLMVLGLILGTAMGRDGHAVFGLLIGFLVARVITLGRKIDALERRGPSAERWRTDSASREPIPERAEAAPAAEVPESTIAGRTEAAALAASPVTAGAEERLVMTRDHAPESSDDSLQPDTAGEDWRALARDSEPPASPADTGGLPERPPRRPVTAQPAEDEPGLLLKGLVAVRQFFTTGNVLVRVGALVLFVAVAFLLSYLAERVEVPIGLRLTGIAAGGLAMVVLGVLLRRRRPGFALPFQGAGIGVLYLTTFAALRLYPVLTPGLALALLLVIVILTIGLSLWQDAAVLAAIGVIGGFLAPILTSTGQGSHVQLFGFYLALNGVVAGVAWFRAWRWLNWIGFVSTFGIGSMWGARYYRPEFLATTEPFLVAHVLLYIAVAVLFASRQPPRLKGLVDGTVVFGTPLVGFTLQALLLSDNETALAWSAAGLGGLYLVLRQALVHRDRDHFALLAQCFLALGFGFLTLAIPLAFDARVTSAMWTIEGAAVAWIGLRQSSRLRRWAGYALMGLGSLAYLLEFDGSRDTLAFLNADFIGMALIAIAFGFIGDRVQARSVGKVPPLASMFWLYGATWWWLGGAVELERQFTGGALEGATAAFLALGLVGLGEHLRRRRWPAATLALVAAAVGGPVLLLLWRDAAPAPLLSGVHTLSAAMTLLAGVVCGLRQDRRSRAGDAFAAIGVGYWLLSAGLEFDDRLADPLALQAWIVFTALTLVAGFHLAGPLRWPFWRRSADALVGLLAIFAVIEIGADLDPGRWGLPAWLAAFAGVAWLLHRREGDRSAPLGRLHGTAFTTAIAVATGWVHRSLPETLGSAWSAAALGAVPAVFMLAVQMTPLARRWPVDRHPDAYRGRWGWLPALWLGGWLIGADVATPGSVRPAEFWPLLNPVDMACLAALLALGRWWSIASDAADPSTRRGGWVVIGTLAFTTLNAALLRALHEILPIAWDFEIMMRSFTVQASITLLWVTTALALMVAGARSARRWLWMVGAGLMGVVVVKLFAVDTAASGTLARIAAFFGVAIGLFVAGYFVPRPPAAEEPPP